MATTRDRGRLDAVAMKTQRMDNSAAPVTGASEGGGKVVARQLTAAGVTVYVGSRDARRGQAAADEIGGGARLPVLYGPGPRRHLLRPLQHHRRRTPARRPGRPG